MRITYIIVITALLLSFNAASLFSQQQADTSAFVKEFQKIMTFSNVPNLYYKLHTKTDASPVLESSDTISTEGVVFRNEQGMYFKNGKEEVYYSDSFFVRVNNERKAIWVNKVERNSFMNLYEAPFSWKQLQELLKKNYTIQQTSLDNNTSQLQFESKQSLGVKSVLNTSVAMVYNNTNHAPIRMTVNISMQQPASNELVELISQQGLQNTGLLRNINGASYIIRTQKMMVEIVEMNDSKDKQQEMPLWKNVLNYNSLKADFTTKGVYTNYALTKSF